MKTNIDLAGEARTASLVFNEDTMGPTELATSSFGQGYNVTMIQLAAAFSSIINGGYYYEPHMVKRIENAAGATVKNIEPRIVKQTISSSTSEQMRQYLAAVVSEGTGKAAKPAGYAIGGKTGTAEKFPRGHHNYVVSFIGFAPVDDPQVVVYVVIDEPNVDDQPHSTFASTIVRDIMTEVLPYMNIFMTEELTVAEQEELANWQITTPTQEEQQAAEQQNETEGTGEPLEENNTEGTSQENTEKEQQTSTGPLYIVDPNTGQLVDPQTGEPAEMEDGIMEEITPSSQEQENNAE